MYVSNSLSCSWVPSHIPGFHCPVLISGFVPSLIVLCFTMFPLYAKEVFSFLKGNGREVGLWGDRACEGNFKEWREEKLQ